jgi:hypothetical protein
MCEKYQEAPKNDAEEKKAFMDTLPLDLLETLLVPAYEEGLVKYPRESWRAGFKTSRVMRAALRHITECYYKGIDYDPDAESIGITKHHLGGAIFSLICMYDTIINHPKLDDRPCNLNRKPEKEKAPKYTTINYTF